MKPLKMKSTTTHNPSIDYALYKVGSLHGVIVRHDLQQDIQVNNHCRSTSAYDNPYFAPQVLRMGLSVNTDQP